MVLAVRSEVDGPRLLAPGASSEIFSSTSRRMMSCSFTCGVSFISSATFSRCTCGNRLPRPSPSPPAAPAAAPAAPPRPMVLTGNGTRWPTEISPSSLFMIKMCGFERTSTSLLVCRALMRTPNDGMSTVDVTAVPRPAASAGDSTGPRMPASIVSPSALVGTSVLVGLRPPTIKLGLLMPNRFCGATPCHEAPSSRVLSSVTSRIIASTKTCLRGESSSSITRRSDW